MVLLVNHSSISADFYSADVSFPKKLFQELQTPQSELVFVGGWFQIANIVSLFGFGWWQSIHICFVPFGNVFSVLLTAASNYNIPTSGVLYSEYKVQYIL